MLGAIILGADYLGGSSYLAASAPTKGYAVASNAPKGGAKASAA